jgi:hypothetical protein
MSTKNLARTVIEGGRTRWSRDYRRALNVKERARQREALGRLAVGDDPEALVVPPPRNAGRGFDDKLGPARRWLTSQIGRPWNLVRGELLRRFDTRTTAGRHIVFCHMLPWVEDDEGNPGWKPFLVDRHGFLRAAPPRALWRSPHARAPLPRDERALMAWLAGRRVGARGPALFWFAPTAAGGYRQHHRLADDDAALWRALPDWFRACHVPCARPPETKTNPYRQS